MALSTHYRLYDVQLATATARQSRYGFQVGGRLLNMQTLTLSPGAPETRRGFFSSAAAWAAPFLYLSLPVFGLLGGLIV
jgi:hypothetical protein